MPRTSGEPAPVAQPIQSFSSVEKEPQYYNDMENTILLSFGDKDQKVSRSLMVILFSRFEKVMTNQSMMRIYRYFLETGASYPKEISKKTGITLSTVYRAIDQLNELGLITSIVKLQIRKTHGDKPTLWGINGASEQEQQRAAQRYIKANRKTYKLVEQLVQRTLIEVRDEEIQFSKICSLAKKMGPSGFHFIDLSEQAALELKEKNITVWR